MTVSAPREYAIERVDVAALGEADLRALARFQQILDAERVPEDPPTPLALMERRFRNRPPTLRSIDWIAKDGDDLVAAVAVAQWTNITNPHWRELWLRVRRDHRRRGIGSALLQRVVDECAGDDEIVLAANTSDRVDGAELARRVGAKAVLENRTSELRLADIDRDLVAEWARIDPPGYRLAWIDGDTPAELMPNVLTAYDAMNTAPHGDMSFGEERMTEEQIREWEAMRRKNGGQRRLVLAIEEATGVTAGYTEIGRHPDTPWTIGQYGTAVIPGHRGRGIGKWVKARMIERLLGEWGDARCIRTGNAYLNAPMLSINDRLGFRVTFSVTVWEVAIGAVRRYLEGRAAWSPAEGGPPSVRLCRQDLALRALADQQDDHGEDDERRGAERARPIG